MASIVAGSPDEAEVVESVPRSSPARCGRRLPRRRRWTPSRRMRRGQSLAAAIGTLPPDERTALLLAYRDGLSQSEIAARLSWPLGTVKTRSRRALRRLRTVLGEPAPAREPDGQPRGRRAWRPAPERRRRDPVRDLTA